MAKVIGGLLSGVVGDYVYKIVNGKQRVSARPVKKKKKKSDPKTPLNIFGMTAKLGAAVRASLSNQLINLEGNAICTRLTSPIMKSLKGSRDEESQLFFFEPDSFGALSHFEFNSVAKMYNFSGYNTDVSFEDKVIYVSLEGIKFPTRAFRCEAEICVSLFRLRDGFYTAAPEKQTIEILKTTALGNIPQLRFDMPDGCLCIVSLFLKFYEPLGEKWIPMNGKKFNPGNICGVYVSPGTYKEKDKRSWQSMLRFEQF